MKQSEIEEAARHRETMEQLSRIESELMNRKIADNNRYYREYNERKAEKARYSTSSEPGFLETFFANHWLLIVGILLFFGCFGWVISIVVGIIQLLTGNL